MISVLAPLIPHLHFAGQIIIILFVSIIFHELGHYWAAKKAGCGIEVFSIGFGRPLFQITRNGIVYQICWLLLGGYCGLQDELNYSNKKTAFTNMSYRNKCFIVFAGPAVNCLSGLLALGLAVLFQNLFLFHFSYLSILLGLSNVLIPIPGLDGMYPLLFLLEKLFGKKRGLNIIRNTVNIGMMILNVLNMLCVLYLGYKGVIFLINLFGG